MITPILVLIFLGIAVYFDLRYRGMPKFLPALFCGIGVVANLLMGSKIDETFALLLLICVMICLVSFTRLIARHDAMMLCAITLTTPFMGWMPPSVVCLFFGFIGGFTTLLILCKMRNSGHPHIDVKNTGRKMIKLAKIISHVNNGERFVVPAIKIDRGEEKSVVIFGKKIILAQARVEVYEENLDLNISRGEMGKTDSKYVIPVIPLMPFFAGVYVVLLVMYLI